MDPTIPAPRRRKIAASADPEQLAFDIKVQLVRSWRGNPVKFGRDLGFYQTSYQKRWSYACALVPNYNPFVCMADGCSCMQLTPSQGGLDRIMGAIPGGGIPDSEALSCCSHAASRHRQRKRFVIHSGHGIGKTAWEAFIAFWFSVTRPGSIVIDTAPTYERQVAGIFWPAIRKFAMHKAVNDGAYEIQKTKLLWNLDVFPWKGERATHWEITGESAANEVAIAGKHSDRGMMVIFDEASGINDNIFEALEGTLTSTNADYRVILCGNPTKRVGEFYRAFYEPRYEKLYMRYRQSCIDSSERVGIEFIENMKRKYGEDSPMYRSRVLGLPPDSDPSALIPFDKVMEAIDRHEQRKGTPPSGLPRIGVDVARFGDDDSVVIARRGNRITSKRTVNGFDTMQVADLTAQVIRDEGGEYETLAVDSIGVGGGVIDALRRTYKARVTPINVQQRAQDPETFHDVRAELCWRMKDWFLSDKAEIPQSASAAQDDPMVQELLELRVTYESGRTRTEPKEAMKRRIRRSPDQADALMLTFAGPPKINWERVRSEARNGNSFGRTAYSGGVCL